MTMKEFAQPRKQPVRVGWGGDGGVLGTDSLQHCFLEDKS